MLAVFAAAGLALEALHAFKVGAYLDAGAETRRLMLRLCHSHGALLGLCQLAFAFCADRFALDGGSVGARSLHAASVLMPVGFLWGGLQMADNGIDPGVGVFMVPPGGLFLVVAAGSIGWQVWRQSGAKSAS